ncbi:hypothetical protein ScPMuIL_001680 [Solemya velum]
MSLSLILCLTCLVSMNSGILFRQEKWNDLKVTWGPNPLGSKDFVSMPRTEQEAVTVGFTKFANCSDNPQLRGNRYMKKGDTAVILLYDVHGYIAGIQAGVPKDTPNFPPDTLKPPFLDDGNTWVMTAYFVDPSTICTTGRSAQAYETQGTGTNLYIQNGTNPETDTMLIPHEQSNIGTTDWTKGHCFITMGVHYWYDLTLDMSCDRMFPVFLMYNEGTLTGFGWAFQTGLNSTRYEHPTSSVLGTIVVVPLCDGLKVGAMDMVGGQIPSYSFRTDRLLMCANGLASYLSVPGSYRCRWLICTA